MNAQADLSAGTRLARYTIESTLGRGAMSVVYAAHDARLGRRVALKVVAPAGDRARFRERFLRESRLAASIDHPNVIPIYEAGEEGDFLYIAMRLVPGTDLRGLLREEGPLPPARALAVVAQAAGALDAAHARGLLHGDVKPGNILLASDELTPDHVYLSDFGLAVRGGDGALEGGRFHGTPEYAAPEQIEGRPGLRSDVYSLACVLFECLTGQPPFRHPRLLGLLWAHLNEEPPRLSERCDGCPPQADAVMGAALAKVAAERPETCGSFVAAMRSALGLERPAPRRRTLLAAGVAAALALAAAAAVLAGGLVDRGSPAASGAGTISTFAGTGTRGSAGDGGDAVAADLENPYGLAVEPGGAVYVSGGYRVRRVDADGTIETVAGTGRAGYSGDGGPATEAAIGEVRIALDPAGRLHLLDWIRPVLRRIEATGTIVTVAGTGRGGTLAAGPRTPAGDLCSSPEGPAFDSAGRAYVSCGAAHRVVRIEADGTLTTVAGSGEAGYSGDGGPATRASLNRPTGIGIDREGNLFIADTLNHRLRKVDPSGTITTIAGTGEPGLSGDGWRATGVSIWSPSTLAVGADGTVYFVEAALHRVRAIGGDGVLTTVAGTGRPGFSGDGGSAVEADLFLPESIAVDGAGVLYVADRGNQRLRRVMP